MERSRKTQRIHTGVIVTMPGINIGTSVLKREAKSIDQVERQFTRNGWKRTGSALGGRVVYLQNSGMNISIIEGPSGTVVMPSGPIRSKVFGSNFNLFSRTSVIGAGTSNKSSNDPRERRQTSSDTETLI